MTAKIAAVSTADRSGEDVVAELRHVTHRGAKPEAGGMRALKGA
jgi:hypothetical protein